MVVFRISINTALLRQMIIIYSLIDFMGLESIVRFNGSFFFLMVRGLIFLMARTIGGFMIRKWMVSIDDEI